MMADAKWPLSFIALAFLAAPAPAQPLESTRSLASFEHWLGRDPTRRVVPTFEL